MQWHNTVFEIKVMWEKIFLWIWHGTSPKTGILKYQVLLPPHMKIWRLTARVICKCLMKYALSCVPLKEVCARGYIFTNEVNSLFNSQSTAWYRWNSYCGFDTPPPQACISILNIKIKISTPLTTYSSNSETRCWTNEDLMIS